MGQTTSNAPRLPSQKQKKPRLRRQEFFKYLKKLTKHSWNKRRKARSNLTSTISTLHLPKSATGGDKVLPVTSESPPSNGNTKDKQSKHSLISVALSKLAVIAELSKEKLFPSPKQSSKVFIANKLVFSGHTFKPNSRNLATSKAEKATSTSTTVEGSECSDARLCASKPVQTESGFSTDDKEVGVDINENKFLKDVLIRSILSSGGRRKDLVSPEEIFSKNMQKFEALLALTATATSASSEDDSDSLDENSNIKGSNVGGRFSHTSHRVISTSKNRIERDEYFMEWLKTKAQGPPQTTDEVTVAKAEIKKSSSSSNSEESSGSSSGSASQGGPGHTSRSHTPRPARGKSSNHRICVKRGPCAGKLALAAAPPAYLDYGNSGSFPGAAGRKARDPIIEKLKNVDVVEQLTYQVPNEGCGEEDEDDDDCEYYAVCESCGEMEPVPQELARKLKSKNEGKSKATETTPVTYSRRQRFNFKQRGDDDDDDGPPFRYDGTELKTCRCTCCVAGLRRNPDCGCKCCQSMGNSRKVNSFDEIPVGKNPQIRKIPCPAEEYQKRVGEFARRLPEKSGLYMFGFDECGTEIQYERQVPRTPTPIILEVPAPRSLNTGEIMEVVKGVTRNPYNDCGPRCCNDPCAQVCVPSPPPTQLKPIYLPPMYGQCNPCCPPCCDENNNNVNNNNNDHHNHDHKKPKHKDIDSGYTYTNTTKTESGTSSSGTGDGTESSSLPSS